MTFQEGAFLNIFLLLEDVDRPLGLSILRYRLRCETIR